MAKDIVNDIINYIAQFPTSDNYMTRRRDKLFSPLEFRRLLSLILVVHNFFQRARFVFCFLLISFIQQNCIKTKLQKRGFTIHIQFHCSTHYTSQFAMSYLFYTFHQFNVLYIMPFQNHFDGMNLFKTYKLTLLREFKI